MNHWSTPTDSWHALPPKVSEHLFATRNWYTGHLVLFQVDTVKKPIDVGQWQVREWMWMALVAEPTEEVVGLATHL